MRGLTDLQFEFVPPRLGVPQSGLESPTVGAGLFQLAFEHGAAGAGLRQFCVELFHPALKMADLLPHDVARDSRQQRHFTSARPGGRPIENAIQQVYELPVSKRSETGAGPK